ncbi:MAG: metalloregulator ArsR/SmtB family transcription factor [Actinomycetota bacterium]|jgi:ArsR family transcriptional regulator|nr:metalloregulator ArsR/SmtB family transcription factor [Actinomycetota bacterium]
MQEKYKDLVKMLKGLADETRLKIMKMLSSGELCACKILEEFDITQPTLSYHMKILTDCGLVNARREGAWMKYTINDENLEKLKEIF